MSAGNGIICRHRFWCPLSILELVPLLVLFYSHPAWIETLQDFGQHGRELVTTEVAFRLLQILAGEYPLGGDIDGGALSRILPHTTIKVRTG